MYDCLWIEVTIGITSVAMGFRANRPENHLEIFVSMRGIGKQLQIASEVAAICTLHALYNVLILTRLRWRWAVTK